MLNSNWVKLRLKVLFGFEVTRIPRYLRNGLAWMFKQHVFKGRGVQQCNIIIITAIITTTTISNNSNKYKRKLKTIY